MAMLTLLKLNLRSTLLRLGTCFALPGMALPLVAVPIVSLSGLATASAHAQQPAKLQVAIVGLVHDHISGWFSQLGSHPELEIVGIAEPSEVLRAQFAAKYHLAPGLFYASESDMLAHTHPQAVLVYTSIAGHRAAIEEAARHHIASMVEKPLSTTLKDARAIEQVSKQYNVPVLVNYETTWYASNAAAAKLLWSGQIGDLRKLVVHDGHKGPLEIGVSPQFGKWLTDPVENGAGALFDFGCYGVDLATWLMHGEAPVSVTAVTQQIKPQVYPKVEDEATILLKYPHAQAIIQGSWNWPFERKDMEVYGATGYVDTVALTGLRVRLPGEKAEQALQTAPPLPATEDGSVNYLNAVLTGKVQAKGDLSALDTNVTVMRILDAARESAKTGKTVELGEAGR